MEKKSMDLKEKKTQEGQKVVFVLGSRHLTGWVVEQLAIATNSTFYRIEEFPGFEKGKKYVGLITAGSKAEAEPKRQPRGLEWTKEGRMTVPVNELFFSLDSTLRKISNKLGVFLSLSRNHPLRESVDRVSPLLKD